jgi:tRNA-specific 2-thiouridylase
VAAALLQRDGYEVIGISMHLWCEDKSSPVAQRRSCCSAEDLLDAERVCHSLNIPFYRLNLQQAFQTYVVDYFCNAYSQGLTPNPCIACNQHLKFRLLLEKARSLDATYLATGHYARIEHAPEGYRLLKARDALKDQSYFLFTMGQPELRHLLFPVGHLLKQEVRAMATQLNLPVANKAESQDLCFIPHRDYRAFLSQRCRVKPGETVDHRQEVLGKHQGTAFYTVGQRKGLNLTTKEPLYVIAIDASTNRVIVGPEAMLFRQETCVGRANWVAGRPPFQPTKVKVKIRHGSPEAEALLNSENGKAKVCFQQPQRAIAPGQAAVFYEGTKVLGGGIIESAESAGSKVF